AWAPAPEQEPSTYESDSTKKTETSHHPRCARRPRRVYRMVRLGQVLPRRARTTVRQRGRTGQIWLYRRRGPPPHSLLDLDRTAANLPRSHARAGRLQVVWARMGGRQGIARRLY